MTGSPPAFAPAMALALAGGIAAPRQNRSPAATSFEAASVTLADAFAPAARCSPQLAAAVARAEGASSRHRSSSGEVRQTAAPEAITHENGDRRWSNVRGCLAPVVMTALVAALGLVPMALSHRAGAEVQGRPATVVVGGVIMSTLLTLIVLPTVHEMIGERAARRAESSVLLTEGHHALAAR